MRGVIKLFERAEFDSDESGRQWFLANAPALLFTPEQIIAASADWPEWDGGLDLPGIYFLQRRGKICYVGLAKGLIARLNQHYAQKRPFDAVTVIAGVHRDALADLENIYEEGWRTPWNRARTVWYHPEGRALKDKLAAMDLRLVCDRPEHEWTEEELRALVAKIG